MNKEITLTEPSKWICQTEGCTGQLCRHERPENKKSEFKCHQAWVESKANPRCPECLKRNMLWTPAEYIVGEVKQERKIDATYDSTFELYRNAAGEILEVKGSFCPVCSGPAKTENVEHTCLECGTVHYNNYTDAMAAFRDRLQAADCELC